MRSSALHPANRSIHWIQLGHVANARPVLREPVVIGLTVLHRARALATVGAEYESVFSKSRNGAMTNLEAIGVSNFHQRMSGRSF